MEARQINSEVLSLFGVTFLRLDVFPDFFRARVRERERVCACVRERERRESTTLEKGRNHARVPTRRNERVRGTHA